MPGTSIENARRWASFLCVGDWWVPKPVAADAVKLKKFALVEVKARWRGVASEVGEATGCAGAEEGTASTELREMGTEDEEEREKRGIIDMRRGRGVFSAAGEGATGPSSSCTSF